MSCVIYLIIELITVEKKIKYAQVLETNINLILQAIEDQGKMHEKSMKGTKSDTAGTDTVRQQLGAGNQWAA